MPYPSLELKLWPNPILREECSDCTLSIKDRQEVGKEMIRIMFEANGVGLSGPQVGLLQRIFVMRNWQSPATGLVIVNPEIKALSASTVTDWEGCLSLPWYGGSKNKVRITRPNEVELYFDSIVSSDAERMHQYYLGEDARIVQHEIDHLNGIMIFDYIKGELPRKMYMEKYMKARKKHARIM